MQAFASCLICHIYRPLCRVILSEHTEALPAATAEAFFAASSFLFLPPSTYSCLLSDSCRASLCAAVLIYIDAIELRQPSFSPSERLRQLEAFISFVLISEALTEQLRFQRVRYAALLQ